MKSTIKAIWHRGKQARDLALRVRGPVMGAQFLTALGPLGVVIGGFLWIRGYRARHHSDPSHAQPVAARPDEWTPVRMPATATSGNGAAH